MEWKKRKKFALGGAVLTALITGFFWAGWYLRDGYVPLVEYDAVSSGYIVMLPAVSRWLDILLYPPWVWALVLILTHPKSGSLKSSAALLVFSAATGFLLSALLGLMLGGTLCVMISVVFGLVAGVFVAGVVARADDARIRSGTIFIAAPVVGILIGVVLNSMIGLGVSILFGSVYGLVFSGVVGMVFGVCFSIAFAPVFGILLLIRALRPPKKDTGSR